MTVPIARGGRVLAALYKVEAATAVAAYALAALAVFLDVLAREVLGMALFLGVGKFGIYACAVAAFMGVGLVVSSGGMVRPQFADGLMPRGWVPAVERLADLVSGAVFAVAFVVAAGYVHEAYATGMRAPVLNWPLWPVQLVIPYAFLTVSVRYLAYFLRPALRPAGAEILH